MGKPLISSSTDESSECSSSSISEFHALMRSLQPACYDSCSNSSRTGSTTCSHDSLTGIERKENFWFESRWASRVAPEECSYRQNDSCRFIAKSETRKAVDFHSRLKGGEKMVVRVAKGTCAQNACTTCCSRSSTRSKCTTDSDSSRVAGSSNVKSCMQHISSTQMAKKGGDSCRTSPSLSRCSAGESYCSTSSCSSIQESVKKADSLASLCASCSGSTSTNSSGEGSRSSVAADQASISSSVEKELLEKVDENMSMVAHQISVLDAQLQERMNKNQWERLYVFNNPSVRQHRNGLYQKFCKLQAMREELLSGEFKRAVLEKRAQKQRVKALYSKNGVFSRLYNKRRKFNKEESIADAKKSGLPSAAGKETKDPTPNGNVPSEPIKRSGRDCHERLYTRGMALLKRRKEQEESALRQQQRKEIKEYLEGVLTAKFRAEDYHKTKHKTPTDENLKKLIDEKMQSVVESPEVIKAIFKEKKSLNEEELTERMHSLYRRCGANRTELAKKRLEAELKECTFHPRINPTSSRLQSNIDNEGRLWLERKKNHLLNSIRQKKLDLLRARMRDDHHFRNRVEHDPQIGEAFMNNLCV